MTDKTLEQAHKYQYKINTLKEDIKHLEDTASSYDNATVKITGIGYRAPTYDLKMSSDEIRAVICIKKAKLHENEVNLKAL